MSAGCDIHVYDQASLIAGHSPLFGWPLCLRPQCSTITKGISDPILLRMRFMGRKMSLILNLTMSLPFYQSRRRDLILNEGILLMCNGVAGII